MRILSVILFLHVFTVFSQESFGTMMSNYVPTQKLLVNPASMNDSKTWLDIQIVGLGSYVNNNLVYIKNQNTYQFAQKDKRNVSEDDIAYNSKPKSYHAYTRTYVQLLSAVWNQGNHAVGFSLGARSFTAARRIPEFVDNFIEESTVNDTFFYNKHIDLKNIRVSSANYAQLQLSYSNIFLKEHRNMYTAGVSIKKFVPIVGVAGTFYTADLQTLPDSTLRINSLAVDGMYGSRPNISFKGGWGIDIGFSYQKMLRECSHYYPNSKKMGCVYMPYKYKLAAAIIDLGYIKFKEKDSQFAGYDFSGYTYSYRGTQVTQSSAVGTFEDFESSVEEGQVRNNYKIAIPAMLSLQADYNLWASHVYVYGALNQGIPIGKKVFGTRRANTLMAAARFESKYFDVSVPLSLYEYKRPQLGVSFRFYCLTIGTDKFLSYWGARDYYGTDFYFTLNIPIFYYPACAAKLRNGSTFYPTKRKFARRKKSITKCDAF